MNSNQNLMRSNWPSWHWINAYHYPRPVPITSICRFWQSLVELKNVVIQYYVRHVRPLYLVSIWRKFDYSQCLVLRWILLNLELAFWWIFSEYLTKKWWIILWNNGILLCPKLLRFVLNSIWQFLFSLGQGMS